MSGLRETGGACWIPNYNGHAFDQAAYDQRHPGAARQSSKGAFGSSGSKHRRRLLANGEPKKPGLQRQNAKRWSEEDIIIPDADLIKMLDFADGSNTLHAELGKQDAGSVTVASDSPLATYDTIEKDVATGNAENSKSGVQTKKGRGLLKKIQAWMSTTAARELPTCTFFSFKINFFLIFSS